MKVNSRGLKGRQPQLLTCTFHGKMKGGGSIRVENKR